jgi:FkbM family methyltransferase
MPREFNAQAAPTRLHDLKAKVFSNIDISRLMFKKHFMLRRFGLELLLDRTNLVDRSIINWYFVTGGWERSQRIFLKAMCERLVRTERAPMRFVDVGAHWGLYSLLARQWSCFERIDAFEPDPVNYAQMAAQFFLNDAVSDIVSHKIAVSGSRTLAPWVPSSDAAGNRGGARVSASGAVMIECVPLDELIPADGAIIVAKVDVEGHEIEVISGAKELLRNCRSIWQIETTHPDAKPMMNQLGYELIQKIGNDHYFTNITGLAPE